MITQPAPLIEVVTVDATTFTHTWPHPIRPSPFAGTTAQRALVRWLALLGVDALEIPAAECRIVRDPDAHTLSYTRQVRDRRGVAGVEDVVLQLGSGPPPWPGALLLAAQGGGA